MKIHINEIELRYFIKSTVINILQEKDLLTELTEMSIPLKDYKEKAELLRVRILSYWGLLRDCQLYDNSNTNFNHWLGELTAYIKKFYVEKIEDNKIKIKIKVCEEFIANSLKLIKVISNPNISTLSYMQAAFNLEY